MVNIKSKKSQFFILMALAIASLLAISFGMYAFSNDRSSINQRINTMNSFLSSSEQDLSRQMYILAYRIIFVAETDMLTDGCIKNYSSGGVRGGCITQDEAEDAGFSSPIELLLNEIFFDESVLNSENLTYGVRRIDLFDWNDESLNARASKINVNVSTSNYKLLVDQVDSWNIRIQFKFNLIMNDYSNLASWNASQNIVTLIPISNFLDPLYIKETGDSGSKMAKTPFVNDQGIFDSTKLVENMEKGYYIEDENAPSFLMRLNGETGSSSYGVSRLIDVSYLMNKGVDVSRYTEAGNSIADYQFFSGVSGTCTPSGISIGWFKLDEASAEPYGVC